MTELLANKYPSLRELLAEINDLHGKRLWHDMTGKLEELVKAKEFEQKGSCEDLLAFYANFVSKFEQRLNLVRVALFVAAISNLQEDYNKGSSLLHGVFTRIENEKRRDRERSEALIILKVETAAWSIRSKDFETCKKTLENAKADIDKEGLVDTVVNSTYYRVKSEYLLRTEDFNNFYKHALLYLAYTPLENIPLLRQQAIAYDIGIAALVGDKVYNFGELLSHPIVEKLNGTQAEWLVKLLFAFNMGNIAQYKQLVQSYHQTLDSVPILKDKKLFLEEKMQLMSLMELVFQHSSGNRIIDFSEIARVTGKPLDLVELLLLRALSYSLIRGVIDQVSQTIQVSWVQPRVLDKSQLASVTEKIGAWVNKVDEAIAFLEKEGATSL